MKHVDIAYYRSPSLLDEARLVILLTCSTQLCLCHILAGIHIRQKCLHCNAFAVDAFLSFLACSGGQIVEWIRF